MNESSPLPVAGLVPAAGFATRLSSVLRADDDTSVSKEALPVAGRPLIEHLLLRYQAASIASAVVVLRHGKEDVAQVLEQQKILPVEIVWTEATPSVPHTLARAGESLRGHRVALGFPDILFEPLDAFAALDRRQQDSSADVVLGLFPSDRPGATDMVQLDAASRPIDIVIKDPDCTLEYTWQMALWTPRFTDFLCAAVSRQLSPQLAEVELAEVELQVGDVLRTAIAQGLAIEAVVFDQGSSLDVGTETTLARVDPSHFS